MKLVNIKNKNCLTLNLKDKLLLQSYKTHKANAIIYGMPYFGYKIHFSVLK